MKHFVDGMVVGIVIKSTFYSLIGLLNSGDDKTLGWWCVERTVCIYTYKKFGSFVLLTTRHFHVELECVDSQLFGDCNDI